MAVAGLKTKTAVTSTDTNATSSDVLASVSTSGINPQRDKLDTNYQGTTAKSFILGMSSTSVTLEMDYVSGDSLQQLFIDSNTNDTAVWVHQFHGGSTSGQRIAVKCTGYTIDAPADGKVSFKPTIESVGALKSSTLS